MKAITILNASVCLVALLACYCLNVACCNAAEVADVPGPVRDLAFADDTGACADDGITNDSELVFTWSPPEVAADVAGCEHQWDGGDWTAASETTVAISADEGAHTFSVRAVNGIGEPGEAVSIGVTVDLTGPGIISHTPAGAFNLRTESLNSVTVTFSEAVDFDPAGGGSFTIDDVTITGPEGAIKPRGIASLGGNEYEIAFAEQLIVGTYAVSVGPSIADLAGNLMDQDETEDDIYSFSFLAIEADTVFTEPTTIAADDATYDGQGILEQPPVMHVYRGHMYSLTDRHCTWQQAEAEATLKGGHLVTINDASENTWLRDTFKDTYYSMQNLHYRFPSSQYTDVTEA